MAVTAVTQSIEDARRSVRFDVTGQAGDTYLRVWRVGPSGVPAMVRGWGDGELVGATPVIVRDYEAPLGVALAYYLEAGDVGGPTGAVWGPVAVELAAGECEVWLVDLARPVNSIRAEIEAMPELEYRVNAQAHYVMGRRAPVVTSLPANTPTAELVLLTDDQPLRDVTRGILGSGFPFLLRTSPELGIGNLYLAVLGIVEGRIVADGAAPYRRFRVAVVQVERPSPAVFVPGAPMTWLQVEADYVDWAEVLSVAGTWDALASVFPLATTASPVIPWPARDV